MSCITLLSDLGLYDASVAVARGVLLQHVADVPIVDISHDVTPYHMGQAAYLLSAAWRSFGPGTVHVVLFDIFSDASPRLVLGSHEGHYFLAADNGVLPAALGVNPAEAWLVLELAGEDSFPAWLHGAGRAISALLAGGRPDLPAITLREGKPSIPKIDGDALVCDVMHIDRYENVVINMRRTEFEAFRAGRRFRLQFMLAEEITEVSNHYHDVREGFKLCRFNSAGYLEICINKGHAASLFGLRLGSKHNDIKIFFE